MEQYNKPIEEMTVTELSFFSDKLKKRHELLKSEVVGLTKKIDEISNIINKNIDEVNAIETQYVKIIEEIEKR